MEFFYLTMHALRAMHNTRFRRRFRFLPWPRRFHPPFSRRPTGTNEKPPASLRTRLARDLWPPTMGNAPLRIAFPPVLRSAPPDPLPTVVLCLDNAGNRCRSRCESSFHFSTVGFRIRRQNFRIDRVCSNDFDGRLSIGNANTSFHYETECFARTLTRSRFLVIEKIIRIGNKNSYETFRL